MAYNLVICGGTFDRLHIGHKAFLNFVFHEGKRVMIGVTSDLYVAEHKKNKIIEPFVKRREALIAYLQEKNYIQRVDIFKIDDVIGPGADLSIPLDAIIVTDDTKNGAEYINKVRREKGLSVLPVIVMLKNNNISSSAIRAGKMNAQGVRLVDPYWSKKDHILPDNLRIVLQKPLGNLLQAIPPQIEAEMTITVGDVTTKEFMDKGIYPQIAVIDLVVERKPTMMTLQQFGFSKEVNVLKVQNPAATLTSALWKTVDQAFHTEKRTVILITGEEDLAVIPLVLSAPLGWVIFYGQPHNNGLVSVTITSDMKRYTYSLLKRFL